MTRIAKLLLLALLLLGAPGAFAAEAWEEADDTNWTNGVDGTDRTDYTIDTQGEVAVYRFTTTEVPDSFITILRPTLIRFVPSIDAVGADAAQIAIDLCGSPLTNIQSRQAAKTPSSTIGTNPGYYCTPAGTPADPTTATFTGAPGKNALLIDVPQVVNIRNIASAATDTALVIFEAIE